MWKTGRSGSWVTPKGITLGEWLCTTALHVRARAIDLAVDEALQIHAPAGRIERRAVQVERDDVVAPDERRRHVAREQEVVRATGRGARSTCPKPSTTPWR